MEYQSIRVRADFRREATSTNYLVRPSERPYVQYYSFNALVDYLILIKSNIVHNKNAKQ